MKSQSSSSEQILLKRMKQNKAKYRSLIKLLETKAKSQIPLNIKLILKEKTDDSENKEALEGLKITHELNNELDNIKSTMNESKEKNKKFFDRFKIYKSISENNIIKKIERKQNALSNVLKPYEDKGFYFQNSFLNKNIYNQSGMLLRKKKLIDDYYSTQIKHEGNGNKKIIKYENFYKKLSRETQRRLIISSACEVSERLEKLDKIDEENKFYFERQESLKKKKMIKKLIYENSLLKKLINIDKINLKNRIDKIEEENKKDNNKLLLCSNSIDKEENNINNKSIYNNISKITKDDKSIFNDKESIDNYNDNNINIITRKEIPTSNRKIFEKKYNTLISRERSTTHKKISFNNSIDVSPSNRKTIESSIFQSRLSNINFAKKEYSEIFPILYDKIRNKRRSNLEMIKMINNTNNSTDRTSEKKSFLIKNNSAPNYSTIEDTYGYLLKYRKESKKIEDRLKEYFGDNIKDIDKKNNGFKILNDYNDLKSKILMKNPLNKKIYIKYKDIMHENFSDIVKLNNTVDKKLSNGVIDFTRHYITKINELEQKDTFYDIQD